MCHHLTLPGSSAAAVSYPVKIQKNMTTSPCTFKVQEMLFLKQQQQSSLRENRFTLSTCEDI